jgi:hypothetical protein
MHGPPDPLARSDLRRRLPRREQVPTPSRRQVAAVVLVALVVSGVWVRLADPAALRGSPPTVDPSDPPADVVADSVERLEYVDYTYRVEPGRSRDQVTKVDNTDREVFTAFGDIRKRYTSEDGLWLKFRGEGWRRVEDNEGFDRETVTPFDAEQIRDADLTVLQSEPGTLVVAVNDSDAVAAIVGQENAEGELRFVVDLDSGRLRLVRYRRVPGSERGWWDYTFYNYRSTTVERPPGVPERTLEDLLGDVLEG